MYAHVTKLTSPAAYYLTDPSTNYVPVSELLSKPYLTQRASLINLEKASTIHHGNPVNSSDTVYLSTADQEGNACSFIASNYAGSSPYDLLIQV